MAEIRFFNEDIIYIIRNKAAVRKWIGKAITKEGFRLKELNYIYCSDAHLCKMNVHYLHHHTYTDIITFNLSENKKEVAGEIYISINRVRDNATLFKVPLRDELHRVMIHGVLHLCGYKDKSPGEVKRMRNKEDYYLSLRSIL